MTRGDQTVFNTQCESEEGGIAVVRIDCWQSLNSALFCGKIGFTGISYAKYGFRLLYTSTNVPLVTQILV